MNGLAILTKCLFSQKAETSLVFQCGLLVVCLTFDIRKWSQVVPKWYKNISRIIVKLAFILIGSAASLCSSKMLLSELTTKIEA